MDYTAHFVLDSGMCKPKFVLFQCININQKRFIYLFCLLLCQEMAGCVLQARSGSSVWGEQFRVQTSQWTWAGTAHQAASVHTGPSNRWVGWLKTTVHIHIQWWQPCCWWSLFSGRCVCAGVWLSLWCKWRAAQTRRHCVHRLPELVRKTDFII